VTTNVTAKLVTFLHETNHGCSRTVARNFSVGGLYVCSGGLGILKFDKNTDLWCFKIQFGGLEHVWVAKPQKPLVATGVGCSVVSDMCSCKNLIVSRQRPFLQYTAQVKCRTQAVINLSRSPETCKMLKIASSKPKFIKISEPVIPHQALFQHQRGYV